LRDLEDRKKPPERIKGNEVKDSKKPPGRTMD